MSKLPQGWVECELKDIVSILGDGLHGTPKYSENGDYYFINGNNLNDGKILTKNDTKKVDYEEYQKYKKDLNENTVFVSINGTLGNTAFYNNEKIILGKSACYFNLLPIADKKFIRFLLKTDYFNNYANANATGSTIKNVSLKTMREFKIFLPPFNEQKRIVEKIEEEFGKIDEGIEKLKLAQEQIKQYRQSVLKSAFDGKLYKTTEWDKYTIKDVSTNIQYGYTESASNNKIGPKFLRITDIQNNSVNWDTVPYCKISDDNKSKYLLKNGDFVFARTGATVGKSYMIQNLNEEAVYASYLIRIGFRDNIETKFIKYYFQTNEYWAQIADNQVGIGQPNVNGTKLGNLTINLPTLNEQKQIVKEIEKRFEVADEVEKVITENLEKTEQLKQSILKKAFEGRLVPQDPTDQPASELLAQIKAERKK